MPKRRMRTTRLEPSPCPGCGTMNDAASAPGGAPAPGDYAVCFTCGTPAEYDEALRLVPLPPGTPIPPAIAKMIAQLRARRVH